MFRLLNRLKELYKYRVLIQALVSRELKARYRGTMLGFLWSFLNPLLLLLIYTVVFGFILGARLPEFNESPKLYALFLFCGLLPWQVWFAASVLESSNVLLMQGNLIKKMLFPTEILPIVVVISNLIHFLFGLPILLLFVPILGKAFTPYLLFLPVVILVQFVFTLGISFLVSALTVHFRDIKDITVNLITLWFFSTPNPMTHIMWGYQNCVFYGELIRWKRLGMTFLVGLVLLIFGYYIFDKLRDSFAEEV
jgi:ABC-type polysaccharide/polyol phosphate export permease